MFSVNGIGMTFRAKSVTRISVIAGLGDDVINNFRTSSSRIEYNVVRPTTIMGGGGNDEIDGTLGTSLIDGGDGDDRIYADLGQNVIEGGAGDDNILGSDGDDLISGGPGNDTIDGTGGNDTINGDGGNDRLASDSGEGGIIQGGRGDDELMGNRTPMLFGNAGTDSFRAYFLSSVEDAVPGETVVLH